MGRVGLSGLFDDLAHYRLKLGDRNPSYRRVLEHVRALLDGPYHDPQFEARLEHALRGREFFVYHERPLLILAAMRCEALVEGPRHPLYAWLVSGDSSADLIAQRHVREATDANHLGFWVSLATRRVQTNEVSRAAGWRWPARLLETTCGQSDLALIDIGAAAGLNLVADGMPNCWTDDTGVALALNRAPVLERIGFDTHPLDVRQQEDLLWLRANIWPGERDRLDRFDRAVSVLQARLLDPNEAARPSLVALSAPLVPARLEAIARGLAVGRRVLAFQSFLESYLDVERRALYRQKMHEWLQLGAFGTRAWAECEPLDEPGSGPPSQIALSLKTRIGEVERFVVGRCDYHPRAVAINRAEVARLTSATSG
jgi:hypothetical protein